MNKSWPPVSSAETTNTEPVQFFECESLSIEPGTKVRLGRTQRRQRQWIIIGAVAVAAAMTGLFFGWLLFGGILL